MAKTKLTRDQKREIAQKYEAKEANIPQLAREYGVSTALIYRIKTVYRNGQLDKGANARNARARVLYPRLEEWRQENRMTQEMFAQACGLSRPALRCVLCTSGGAAQHVNGPSKTTIDKILRRTGLTYEEAFKSADCMDGN